ncbi:hypothetical protein H180DRAFT_03786 [Streptomyces sp. WMMB 322]|nr:hypothetical protein H180DRAFT_03786 [Streptomyces sp. WMMB 322]
MSSDAPPRLRTVFTPLTVALAVAALALAAWCGWAAYRDQPTKDWHFIGMAVVSLLALVQLVVGIVKLAGGGEAAEGTVIFLAYLAAVAACVPVVGLISLTERTKWGSLTVAAGALVLAVLQARLHEIWGGGHGG